MSLKGAALALLVAAAARAEGEPPFAWPTPDLLQQIDVPGDLRAQGVPVRLRAVRLKRALPEVIRLYVDAFQRARLYLAPPERQLQAFQEPALTALDPRRKLSYTVVFRDNHDGTTTLVLGEANLGWRTPARDELPLFPGAREVVRADLEGARAVRYEVDAPLAEIQAFHADAMARAGYVRSSSGDALVFTRESDQVRLSASRAGGRSRVLLWSKSRDESAP